MTTGKRKGRPERKKPAISFSHGDWSRLRAALEKDSSPEAAVLLVMHATGLRISDTLGVRCAQLQTALRDADGAIEVIQKGNRRRTLYVRGAPAAWARLGAACKTGATVAAAVCPRSKLGTKGGGGAYQRVNRKLRELGEQLELSGRPHLHRLRRTVATTALKHTRDVHLVSNLLGHKALTATSMYLDEVRDAEVADLQHALLQKVHG